MSTIGLNPTNSGGGFLRFNSLPPRLHITADDPEFDEITIQKWRDEGFDVTYLPLPPYPSEERAFMETLRSLNDDLELGEAYALVAYGRAATLALHAHQKPQHHLAALIAYYPDEIPNPNAKFPPHMELVCHLAGDQPFNPSFKSYRYPGTTPGFAEHDLDEFEKVSSELSWTRSLACVRKGFKKEVDLEPLRENHFAAQFVNHNTAAALGSMVANPYVNNIPTMTGGIGKRDLQRFYKDFFMPSALPTLTFRLISRTMGVDRVVDEMYISFRHTKEIPWLLPGVPPTDKTVEVVLVSIVTIYGGKLVHEHVYWDQASVLVQVGLLDPKLVPENMKSKGLKRLPVVGREGARKALDEESHPSNELIPRWNEKKLPIRGSRPPAQNGHAPANNTPKLPVDKGKVPAQNGNAPANNTPKSPVDKIKVPVQNGNTSPINKGKNPVWKIDSPIDDAPQTPLNKGKDKLKGIPVQMEDEATDSDISA